MNFQTFKFDFKKAEEPQIKFPTPVESLKKHESSRKKSTSALLTMPKSLTVWITVFHKLENSSRDETTRPCDLPLEKSIYRSRILSYNWTCNNILVPNGERSALRLHIVTLLI